MVIKPDERDPGGLLVLALPFIAVLIHADPCLKVLWALLPKLLGQIPGVIYSICQVTRGSVAETIAWATSSPGGSGAG